ncbi:MAG: hypothetical protein H7141_00165 [Burkholderiales bacterium]|nr:hypothetical protein [Bacteroidia bacterium]
MTLKTIKRRILPLLVAVVTFNSCVKKNIDMDNMADQQWTPELAIPLVNSNFTIKDILLETDKAGQVSVDGTGFCTLVYKGNLFSVKGTDLIPLTNNTVNTNYSLTTGDAFALNALTTGSTYTMNFNNLVTYSTGNSSVKIDELTLKTCDFNIAVNSTLKQSSVLTISIPAAKKGGIPFVQTIAVPASTGGNVNINQYVDLAGYVFDMTNGATTTNKFMVNYKIVATKTAALSTVAESFQITQAFSNQSFLIIKGDVGQQSIGANIDTVAISIFKNAVPSGGDFRINYATIDFTIDNSYGIPIRLNNIQLFPYGPGQSFPFSSVPLPSAYTNLDINAPVIVGASAFTYPPQIGGPSSTQLNAIINSKPKNFIYNVASQTNPNGIPSASQRNFITDQSQFKVDMELRMPLYGGAWDFVFKDTVPFDFGKQTSDNINSILFRVYTNNGFPFDISMNLDFVDTNYVVMQTLAPGTLYADVIKSAPIDGSGIVIGKTEKTNDFTMSKVQINTLRTVKHIIVRATGATTNNGAPDIKIYDYYNLNVRMGVKGEFNFPLKK